MLFMPARVSYSTFYLRIFFGRTQGLKLLTSKVFQNHCASWFLFARIGHSLKGLPANHDPQIKQNHQD